MTTNQLIIVIISVIVSFLLGIILTIRVILPDLIATLLTRLIDLYKKENANLFKDVSQSDFAKKVNERMKL